MKLNERIKENRKKAGLTQEQIARYLGISAPAVNKWEKGATFPDITLLPALARLLKIDLNTLLDFREEMTDSEINRFTSDLIKTMQSDGFEKSFTKAVKQIQEFPDCSKLVYTTAITLQGGLIMSGLTEEQKEPYHNRITEFYERVAAGNDAPFCERAAYMLASRYMLDGKYQEAQEKLDAFPKRDLLDKRQLQAELLIRQNQLEDAAILLEHKLQQELQTIQWILQNLADIAVKEENWKNAAFIAEVSHNAAELFDAWDYTACVVPLSVALARKDVNESNSLLKSMLTSIQKRWKYEDSILYHHIAKSQGAQILEKSNQVYDQQMKKQSLSALRSELQHSPKYEFLKSSPDFQKLITEFCTPSNP